MQAENINIFGLGTMVYIVCFAKFFFSLDSMVEKCSEY